MFTKITYLRDAISYVEASGKLDIYNAPDYLDKIKEHLRNRYTTELVLDFSQINFVASIGLRAILELHKIMQRKNGLLKIRNVTRDVLYTFEITGFDKFLVIENDSDNLKEELEKSDLLIKQDDYGKTEYNFINKIVKTEMDDILDRLNKWHYQAATIMGCNNSIENIKSSIIQTLLQDDLSFNKTIEFYEKISKNEYINEWTNLQVPFNVEIQQIFSDLISKLKAIRAKIKRN